MQVTAVRHAWSLHGVVLQQIPLNDRDFREILTKYTRGKKSRKASSDHDRPLKPKSWFITECQLDSSRSWPCLSQKSCLADCFHLYPEPCMGLAWRSAPGVTIHR